MCAEDRTLTAGQRRLVRLALGIGGTRTKVLMNQFVAHRGSCDHEDWMDMVGRGLARKFTLTGMIDVFSTTREVADSVLEPGETQGEDSLFVGLVHVSELINMLNHFFELRDKEENMALLELRLSENERDEIGLLLTTCTARELAVKVILLRRELGVQKLA